MYKFDNIMHTYISTLIIVITKNLVYTPYSISYFMLTRTKKMRIQSYM